MASPCSRGRRRGFVITLAALFPRSRGNRVWVGYNRDFRLEREADVKPGQYQVHAFATRVFEGNPAAICPLQSWFDNGLLPAIAAEDNLSVTAFFVPADDGFELRWFTPLQEVDLRDLLSQLRYLRSSPILNFQRITW